MALSRRDFFKMSGSAGAALALATALEQESVLAESAAC